MRRPSENIVTGTLSNGLRAVHLHLPGSAVGCTGLYVRAGSRDEESDRFGLAHFVEHTIFKGTAHRSASRIINRMEAVGGELNAYTTKEETVVYSTFPTGNLDRATELIADLATASVFPSDELDKERDVVADEIDSYLDSPADAVYDDFEDLLFAGSPLGHNILGTHKTVDTFDSADCRDFVSRHYKAANMVAFYSGPVTASKVFANFERRFALIPAGNKESRIVMEPPVVASFNESRIIPSHQAHYIVGARIDGYLSPRRAATALLSNILGGPGMNSLLNVELRERRGLVYSVEASTTLFSDCGLLTVYFGCDPEDARKCRAIVDRTIRRIADNGLSRRSLDAEKKQYLGQLVIASENRENSTLSAARQLLWRNRVITRDENEQMIADISCDDIIEAARQLVNSSSLVMTPSV